MVHCRAHLLLEKDTRELEKDPVPGITAYLVEAKPLVCYATVSGLPNTEMTDGIFHIGIKCTEHYNEEFPKIFFNTIPFHPNIHPTNGKLVVDFNKHFPSDFCISLKNILIFIQKLLTCPILEQVVNGEAYNLLLKNPNQYKKASRFCAKQSVSVFETLSSKVFKLEDVSRPSTACPPLQIKERYKRVSPSLKSKISFEYYYETWRDMATSQPLPLYEDDMSASERVAHWENEATLQNKPSVVTSPEKRPVKKKQKKSKTIERIAMMKKLYLGQKSDSEDEVDIQVPQRQQDTQLTPRDVYSVASHIYPLPTPTPDTDNLFQLLDEEAQDLVEWTENLDVNL